MMSTANTIQDLIGRGADGDPALLAPDRPALSYGALRQLVGETVLKLGQLGIGRNDRVAIVLPNGPEMAAAFIAIGSTATTAPLNPSYRAGEYRFYLNDLKAKALVIESGSATPAAAVAMELGISIIELEAPAETPAGRFTLKGTSAGKPSTPGPAEARDIGLVLHTSGTTSRPKLVPLSQANICASAQNIAQTLALRPADSCLNIMPLFHIHGLMAAVLASLGAGASIFCSPGFNALKFFTWLAAARSSWYTAVPTMHQAILARAPRNRPVIEKAGLRFVRSSSSSMPPKIMAALEDTFNVPVIESYGMTEAAHQIASNPLPPSPRKSGTVGPADGPEVRLMDPGGKFLRPGETGEIVIRGSNVTGGYEANQDTNASSFTNGWLRTGDLGRFNEDGYLSIVGRIKEIINRGGEKISPREVEEVLLDHPSVAEAVTFAVPHDKLGEDVAAAIVLTEGSSIGSNDIRAFVRQRLADFKVPRRVILVDEIPNGATGKVQRIGLHEKLAKQLAGTS